MYPKIGHDHLTLLRDSIHIHAQIVSLIINVVMLSTTAASKKKTRQQEFIIGQTSLRTFEFYAYVTSSMWLCVDSNRR